MSRSSEEAASKPMTNTELQTMSDTRVWAVIFMSWAGLF